MMVMVGSASRITAATAAEAARCTRNRIEVAKVYLGRAAAAAGWRRAQDAAYMQEEQADLVV
jgi:hypothetical protein